MEFDEATDTLNNYLVSAVTSTTSWTNVSGGLDKVSSSSSGFVWAIKKSDGSVWFCQAPCTDGNWKKVEDKFNSVSDIATDDLNVYVLSPEGLGIKPVNNATDWVVVKTPSITELYNTSSYLWGQDSSLKKYRLAKPGLTGNWITVEDKSGIRITSASNSSLYGVDSSGSPKKSDEILQSGWSDLVGLGNQKYTSILGTADKSAIYGITNSNQTLKCENSSCSPVSTQGYTPSTLTIDPTSRQLWMTTEENGVSGNVFTKIGSTDILSSAGPLDKKRDEVTEKVMKDYNDNTHTSILSKQIKDVQDFLSRNFDLSKKSKKVSDAETKTLSKETVDYKDQLDQFNISMPLIKDFFYLLVVVAIIYFFGSFIGSMIHVISFVVLCGGILYILNKNGISAFGM